MTQSAFPWTADDGQKVRGEKGMTLRDYLAAKAMPGILSSDRYAGLIGVNRFEQRTAEDAYKMADAMMKARQA